MNEISSEDDEEVNMLSIYTTESNIKEACLSEEEENELTHYLHLQLIQIR